MQLLPVPAGLRGGGVLACGEAANLQGRHLSQGLACCS